MRVWRISKKRYAESAFSGEGGLKTPARWNHAGHRIVYTSASLSLATLETWVHVAPPSPLPQHVTLWADIPNDLAVHDISESTLPDNWQWVYPPVIELREIGTNWLTSRSTAVARVPAATTPGEFNYLLNPLHPHFSKIRPGNLEPFTFDPRMWKA